MNKNTSALQLRFFINPVYWFTWLGLGLLYLSTLLRYEQMLKLGTALGWLSYILMPSRRRITRTNIRLVFPQLDKKAITQLVKQSFYSASIAVLESAWAWWGSDDKIKPLLRVEGVEHLEAARQLGKGVMLLGGHYTTLEISGRLLSYFCKAYPTYKRAHNDLFELYMTRGRRNIHKGVVRSTDMRSMIRLLKENEIVWYAPDQDFGMHVSVFAPFMGVQTATLTLTARLAARSGAAVVPYASQRLPGNKGYVLRFDPMLQNFPSNDDVLDATAVNAAIEKNVRLAPAQYLWGHRRFKTRPRGEPQLYQIRRGKFLRRYTYAHILLSIPVFLYTTLTALRNRQLRYFMERLGLSLPAPSDLIVHAASIGEVKAVAPLLELIQAKYPHLKILFSMNTPSGRLIAEKLFAGKVTCHYMPIDWHWLAYRYLKRVSPKCVLIVETEIWPNFYEYCHYQGISLFIVNARLSQRSLQSPRFVLQWLSEASRQTTAVFARSAQDAERYKAFAIPDERLKVLGNLKYAASPHAVTPIEINRHFVLFASSRDNEELPVVQTWLSACNATQLADKPLLVIVPRHIRRSNTILTELKDLNLNIAVRSQHDRIDDSTHIYLADTFGELAAFIASADFVIMGGSFEPYGGQNIIEVAHAGKAVVFGTHMENFELEAGQFMTADAAIRVKDQLELKDVLHALLNDPVRVRQLGSNANNLVKQHAQVAEDYLHELEKMCDLLNPATNRSDNHP